HGGCLLRRLGGGMQRLAPGLEVGLHFFGPLSQHRVGPHRPALQIPAQLLRFDRPERCDQPPPVALNDPLANGCGFVEQLGIACRTPFAVFLVKAEVAELEHQFRHRLRSRLEHRRPVGGEA
ncbi:MAG: hypothetical protein ACK55I_17825, partial [bacterium]